MDKAILGTKIGMTQIFLTDGRLMPVTVVQAGPCTDDAGEDRKERRL